MSYRSLWLAVFGASLFVNACLAPVPSTSTVGEPTPALINSIASTTNLTDGCITTYDPTVDYFPEKATLTHSDGFTIEYFKHYKVITVRTPAPSAEPLQYVLVQCGAPPPTGFAEAQISQVPVKSIVAMSSTFVTTLDELNLLDRLVGLDEATYISNAKILQMADAGQLTMIGIGAGVNVEQALDLQPDLIMAVSAGNVEFDAHPKLQEALQRYVVPQTVHFEIENPAVSDRDELFRLREFAEVAKTLYEAKQGDDQYLMTRDEVRLYLAEADDRFGRLTTEQEAVSETDNDMDLARSLPAVQTLTDGYRRGWWPDEPLIERSWQRLPSGRETVAQRTLPWSVAELAQPKVWVVA